MRGCTLPERRRQSSSSGRPLPAQRSRSAGGCRGEPEQRSWCSGLPGGPAGKQACGRGGARQDCEWELGAGACARGQRQSLMWGQRSTRQPPSLETGTGVVGVEG